MRRFDVAWLLLWGVLSSAWCLSASRELSATFDEGLYLRWGVTSWRSGSNFDLMRAGTMPLPVDVQYLPIHLWENSRGEAFEVPFDPSRIRDAEHVKKHEADFHRILPYARAMNLLFWWILLIYGTLVARQFGGPWAGRFATVLFATEPNLLGHACLATTDIAVTAMILVFTWHWQHGRDRGPVLRWLLPGVLYGVALAAKASALTFIPLIMLAFEIPRLYAAGAFSRPPDVGRVRHLWRETKSFRRDCLWVLFFGIIVVVAFCGSDWKPQPRFVQQADAMPDDGRWTQTSRWLAHNLAIFPNAGEGFQYQVKHNIKGHGAALLGEWHPRAVWYYFPVALTIKFSLTVLALLAGLLLLRPKSLLNPVTLAALLLLAFSLNCRVQIGVRLVFPLMVMILLVVAVGLGRTTARWSEKGCFALLGVVVAACAYPAIAVWPDGLRFSNELWGGPESTYKHLADSNHDWGQGVKDLDCWTDANNQPKAGVWYFGSDPVILNDLERNLSLHNPVRYKISTPSEMLPYLRGKVVAVSLHLLYGQPNITPTMPMVIEFFRGQQPIGRTRTFFVYDFREVPAP
jgi:hypothetical protein